MKSMAPGLTVQLRRPYTPALPARIIADFADSRRFFSLLCLSTKQDIEAFALWHFLRPDRPFIVPFNDDSILYLARVDDRSNLNLT